MKLLKNQRGMLDVLLIVILAVLLAAGGYLYYRNHHKKTATPVTSPATTSSTSSIANEAYAGWKTYTSTTEKATFKYPPDWKPATSAIQSNDSRADTYAVVSPSSAVKVTWVSVIDGLGGGCNDTLELGADEACPQTTYSSKQAIVGAKGLSVISAVLTTDGKTFQPALAVLDTSSVKLGASRALPYDEFTGRNNGLIIPGGQNTGALFTTGGATISGPALSQAEANAWFSKPEVKQAKLILESLTY